MTMETDYSKHKTSKYTVFIAEKMTMILYFLT